MIRQLTKSFLGKFGYEIRKRKQKLDGFNPHVLAQVCHPKTVIDVGASDGTPYLFEAFPDATFVLIEPLSDYGPRLRNIEKQYRCEIIHQAVSDQPGTMEIIVDEKNPFKSSFSERTALTQTGNHLTRRRIDMTTLDTIYAQRPAWEKPILLKIDTEGHELKVLQGGQALLNEAEIVIAETSIARRFQEGYEFEDMILFMKSKNFSVFSLKITHPAGELQPRYADIIFKRG